MKNMIIAISLLCAAPVWAADSAACDDSTKLYKVCSDQEDLYRQAAAQAIIEKKFVLITFGAEWCEWCKTMHAVLENDANWSRVEDRLVKVSIAVSDSAGTDIAAGQHLVQTLLDMNHVDKSIFRGIPFLAVVDPISLSTVFIDTGDLEDNTNGPNHDPEKVVAALKAATQEIQRRIDSGEAQGIMTRPK